MHFGPLTLTPVDHNGDGPKFGPNVRLSLARQHVTIRPMV